MSNNTIDKDTGSLDNRSPTVDSRVLHNPSRDPSYSLQSHMFPTSVYLVYHTYKKTTIYSDDEDWPKLSARHAGMLADNRTPVGFGSIIFRKLRFGNSSLRS